METLADQFKGALTRIELNERRARVINAHTEIRAYLETNDQLNEWGIDTILIGSYARSTAIYPGKDVDVFAKLTNLDTTAAPGVIYNTILQIIVAKYGDRAKPQPRSIKVVFALDSQDDFAVDIVPAVSMGVRWGIPSRNQDRWKSQDFGERWLETDPEKLTELTSELNGSVTVDTQGAYVPVVKLVRQTRRHHRGDAKPGGFYFELMTYWTFLAGTKGDSFAELLASTLRGIAEQLASATPLNDPALNAAYEPAPEPEERSSATAVFTELADKAARALTLEPCPAAALWREILGTNGRGPCFPLPPGCDESGKKIKNVASVLAKGSGEASGFA